MTGTYSDPAGVGTPFTAAGTFADPGQPDTFENSTVDYGDNTGPQALTLGGQGTFTVAAHHYLEPGNYVADVTIKDDDTGTSASTEISRIPVTAVRVGDLTVTDAALALNFVRASDAAVKHLFVGEGGDGRASVLLDLGANPMRPEVARHLLWKVTGDAVVGAVAGNFAQPPTVTLAPAGDAARTFTVEAGFDDNGDNVLSGSEASRRAEMHVIRPDLDADSDNNDGTAMPSRNATEDGMEAAPPGKYVLLNDDDDNNNDLPDLGEAPVGGEDDLVPLVLGFEHLGSYREGLTYKLSLAGTGADKAGVWADAGKGASVALGTPAPVPPAGSRTVWVEGRALSQVEGDVQFELEILAPTYSAGMLAVAKDDLRETVANVDLDVDSDNNNQFDLPPQTFEEEQAEIDASRTGKLIGANDDDDDGDGIPDYADGYNRDGVAGNDDDAPPTEEEGEVFVPTLLVIPAGIDLSRATMRLEYDASDPNQVQVGGSPVVWAPAAAGLLRLWTADGHVARTGRSFTERGAGEAALGFYVPPTDAVNPVYTPADMADLGFSAIRRMVTVFAEAATARSHLRDTQITVRIDPDGSGGPAGFIFADTIRLTPHAALIRVDANRDNRVVFAPLDSSESDNTSARRPFRFWVNDDQDRATTNPDDGDAPDELDLFPGDAGYTVPDAQTPYIDSARDLEDFLRLRVQAPPGFDVSDASWFAILRLNDPQSALRVSLATLVSQQEASGYLTDPAIAGQLAGRGFMHELGPGAWVSLKTAFSPAYVNADGTIDILVEGVGSGTGELIVAFGKDGEVAAEDNVHLDMRTVTDPADVRRAAPRPA